MIQFRTSTIRYLGWTIARDPFGYGVCALSPTDEVLRFHSLMQAKQFIRGE